MHIMAGLIPEGTSAAGKEKMMKTYLDNIIYAADRLSQVCINLIYLLFLFHYFYNDCVHFKYFLSFHILSVK